MSKQFRPTPGPWENTIVGVKEVKTGRLICQCWYGQENDSFGNHPAINGHSEYCGNGNLIAQAPEMREVINEVETVFNLMSISADHQTLTPQVRAAINEVWPKVAKLLNLEYYEGGPKLHTK